MADTPTTIAPAPDVLKWLNDSDSSDHYLSTITIAEISCGLQILPEGERRDAISEGSNNS
ncbi:MAG: hypothetical protein O7B25_07060 [Gammaproteobacteria bacterium]|nr:hypothetical protein [Gammaproteobacteria bacterium]